MHANEITALGGVGCALYRSRVLDSAPGWSDCLGQVVLRTVSAQSNTAALPCMSMVTGATVSLAAWCCKRQLMSRGSYDFALGLEA